MAEKPPENRIPVYLLTGFLGSGKTTLLNPALRDPALANTAVVVNELGDIGLDQLAVAQASDNVVLLDAGCLCCINPGALHETLVDLVGRRARGEIPPFERVIIETSGAADPAPLLHVLLGHPLVTPDYPPRGGCLRGGRPAFPVVEDDSSGAGQAGRDGRPRRHHQARPGRSGAGEGISAGRRNRRKAVHRRRAAAVPGCICRGRCFATAGRAASAPTPSDPREVTWASWAAWSRLVAERFGARLLRVKGLLRMEDTGEIVLVHGVQGVFHQPQRFRDWPDADRANRLVCIARDIELSQIQETLKESETQA